MSKTDATDVMSQPPDHYFTRFVGTLRVRPRSKHFIRLGNYTPAHPAKGFSITHNQVKDTSAIQTEIISSGGANHYEMILYITNKSGRTVNAEVWQM